MLNQILFYLWGAILSVLSINLPAQSPLPLNTDEYSYQPIRSLVSADLESDLLQAVNADQEWARLVRNKKLSVGLIDLKDPNNIRFATINGNEMMYAASLPKIAILLAAMDAFECGELEESPEVMDDLNAMIRFSNNQASTRMIDRLGYDKIESVLTDAQYDLYDEDFGGGLWVGKRYAAGGARNPDPLKGLSHAATASQVCRFYYMLSMGQLVSTERSRQMLEIMDDPGLHHKFVNSIDRVAPRARVFRKSGSWKTYHADSVLVWGEDPSRRYILVALAESPEGESIIRQLVFVAEKVLELD